MFDAIVASVTVDTRCALRSRTVRADVICVTAPDDFPRSPTGRVPQWVQDELAGRPPAPTAWRTPSGAREQDGRRASIPRSWSGVDPMPGGWSPVVPDRPRRGRRRAARRRSRRPSGVAVLTTLVVLGGLWWSWSAQNRDTTADLLAGLPAGPFLPDGVFGDQPRRASDGSLLPPAGQEESPTRLLPVVTPATFADQYAFVSPSEDALRPTGWSPCRPVHYVVDLTGAPAGFEENVRLAVAEISAATGLLFVDDGAVIEAANPVRESYLPAVYGDRWAPVLIRFADDVTVPGLAGDIVGQAGGSAMTDPAGVTHYVSGTVYLDVDLLGLPGLGGVPAYLPVLRHELGHLVGLDHVDDPTQIMFPATGCATTFQPGDLTGLSLAGQAECAPDL